MPNTTGPLSVMAWPGFRTLSTTVQFMACTVLEGCVYPSGALVAIRDQCISGGGNKELLSFLGEQIHINSEISAKSKPILAILSDTITEHHAWRWPVRLYHFWLSDLEQLALLP